MQKWENRIIHVSFFYYSQAEYGLAQHKQGEKHITIKELMEIVASAELILNNKKKLSGLNGVLVEVTENGMRPFQFSGYNENIGMYCYGVNTDGSLERWI